MGFRAVETFRVWRFRVVRASLDAGFGAEGYSSFFCDFLVQLIRCLGFGV